MRRTPLLALFVCLLLSPAVFAQEDGPTNAPEMKRAPVPGGELEYEVRGNGEPVLLIHGSHIAASFLPIMDLDVMRDYRLIRYHRRGFAGSTEPEKPFSIEKQAVDARALLRHLGVERVHVIGHSYGGITALQLALDAPEVVQSLALLEPPLGAATRESESESRTPGMEQYLAGDPAGAVDEFMRVVVSDEWQTDIAQTVPGGPEQAAQDAETFFEVEVPALHQWEFDRGKAQKISQPIIYVWGTEGFGKSDLAGAWWPRIEDHIVDDVTHALQMEDPEAVAEAIADFLRRHPM